MSIFNVKDFGAAGNGVQDDYPAFRQALDTIEQENAGDPVRGAILFIPSGKYRLTQTLVVTRSMILQGAGMLSSRLEFVKDPGLPANTPLAGIVVQKGQRPDGTETFPDWTIIRQLAVQTPNSFFPPDHLPSAPVDDDDRLLSGTSSGIVLYARATIEECYVGGFEQDGIHINTSGGLGRNANIWQIQHCFIQMNGRHGLFVTGSDSNAGCAIGLFAQSNCRWGIYDQAFLGNTYVACVAEANGQIGSPDAPPGAFGGSIRTNSPVGCHTFLGLYSEAGVSVLSYPSMIVGGQHDPGLVSRDKTTIRNPTLIPNYGGLEAFHLRLQGPIATAIRSVQLTPTFDPQTIDPLDSMILVNAETNQPGVFGSVPLTLPSLNDPKINGRQYTIKRIDKANTPVSPGIVPVTVSVAPGAAEKIDGATSIELIQPFSWVTLLAGVKSTATAVEPNWYIIARG